MPGKNDNRVLARRNAGYLDAEAVQKILGDNTNLVTLLPSIPFHPDF